MQSIKTMSAGAALLAVSTAALAHDQGGWASIHWHASDALGLAVVGALSVAALWLARRQPRTAKRKQ